MMVAAITAMPPPCGVGTVCDERAFGLASAMRCSQRPDRENDRDAERERDDESGCRDHGPNVRRSIAHAFTQSTYVWQGTLSDFPRPHRDDQSEIVQECLAVNAGMEKADLPAEETALP